MPTRCPISIIIVYIGLLMYRPVTSVNFTIGPNSTWGNAYEACTNNDGMMPNLTTVSTNIQNINGSGAYWIGQFKALSPWMWMRGCYSRTSQTDRHSGTDPTTVLSAGVCAFKCAESKYFALSDAACICLGETKLPLTMKLSTSRCKKCKETDSICGHGQHNTVFLYEKYGGTPELIYGKEGNRCVSVRRNNSDNWWETTSCSENYLTVCKILPDPGEEYLIKETIKQWKDALKVCSDKQGYVADIDTVDGINKIRGVTESELELLQVWTGLFREDVDLSVKDFRENLTVTKCSYLQTSPQHHLYHSPCNETREYLCMLSDERRTRNLGRPTLSSGGTRDSKNAIIGGSLGGIIFVLTTILVVVVLIHRNRSKPQTKKFKGTRDLSNEEYSYIETEVGSTHILVGSRLQSDPEAVEYSEAFNGNNNIPSHTQTSHQPVTKNQPFNIDGKNNPEGVYLDTADGDYDVLGRKREHRSNQNIDHLYGGLQDDGVYDVTRNAGNISTTGHLNDLYDRTRATPDNDNTYDSTANVDPKVNIISENVYFNSKQVK